MGVRLDPGRDPQQHRRREPVVRVQRVETVELVERVDDGAPDRGRSGHAQLVRALVVAVEHEALGRKAGGQGDVELPAGRDIETQPFLVDEPGHRPAQERLRRVDREVRSERRDGLTTAGPQMLLVVDEQRSAVLGREVEEVDTADRQATRGVDGRGVRQEVARDRAHIESGACTPSTSRPIARPIRTASTSQSRACVSSGLTPSPIT